MTRITVGLDDNTKAKVDQVKDLVLDSMKTSFTDTMFAPDESLDPAQAWEMGACYAIEFTARELFFRGIISREDGQAILKHTGGDIDDAERWKDRD